MEGKVSQIHTFSKITPLQKLNENFTLAECTVCGCGKNRNYSYISRETIEKEMYGLNYLPIVAHLIERDDGTGVFIGGHDYTIDENWNFKPLTQVVGCVVNDSFEFREIEEYGESVTYLVCKCILYTEHVPELMSAIYSDDVYFGESMEIEVKQSRPLAEDSNYQEILDFNFLKLCLLGMSDNPEEHTEPCFISSKVYKPEEFELDNSNFDDVMLKLKEQCADYFALRKEGGNAMEDKKEMELEQEPTVEVAPEVEPEVPTEEIATTMAQDIASGTVELEASEVVEPEKEEFSMTYQQKLDAVRKAVCSLRDDAHDYWAMDCDDNYVYVEKYSYEDSKEDHFKCPYTLDESNGKVTVGDEWVHIQPRWLTDEEVAALDAMKLEVTVLRDFKRDVEDKAHKAECDAVLGEFSDLNRFESFRDLKAKAYEFSADDLRKECFAIRGQYGSAKTVKAGLLPNTQESTSYVDDFFRTYSRK